MPAEDSQTNRPAQQERECDLLIVGTGLAGLVAALASAPHLRVLIITKATIDESNTYYAQGGIAAALGTDDSPDRHFQDTISVGAAISNRSAVRALVNSARDAITELIAHGVSFDTHGDQLARGLEAAHSVPRILHSGGAATGLAIQTALSAAARSSAIEIIENAQMLDLLVEGGRCRGARVLATESGEQFECRAPVTVLATGGAGRLYARTSNPSIATGDGIAAALRAGAVVTNLEFMQFHPTALDMPGRPAHLLSEALRGSGATVVDRSGRRFLAGADERAELAPRDVVARAIARRLLQTGPGGVLLDARGISGGPPSVQFAALWRTLDDFGLDMDREPVPVSPVAHYLIGGIRTDDFGRSSLPGLYAAGETASTGAHGANRLASNSLLEAVVFARRVAELVTSDADWRGWEFTPARPIAVDARPMDFERPRLQEVMWRDVGIFRSGDGLARASAELARMAARPAATDRADQETANLAVVGMMSARAALDRTESRGTHFRSDHPDTEPGQAVANSYRLARKAG